MLLFLAGLALAADPLPLGADAVHKLHHVVRVTLAEEATSTMRADHPTFDQATILVLTAVPEGLRPRQQKTPVLFVGDMPIRPVHVDLERGCLAGFVPKHPEPGTTPVFFGPAELPEDIDRARAAEILEAAVLAGARPPNPTASKVARVARVAHLGELVARTQEAAQFCP